MPLTICTSLLALLVLAARAASPCSPVFEPLSQLDPAELMFVGKVVRVTALPSLPPLPPTGALALQVQEVMSGSPAEPVATVAVFQLMADCSFRGVAVTELAERHPVGTSVRILARTAPPHTRLLSVVLGGNTEIQPAADPPSARMNVRSALAQLARTSHESARVEILRALIPNDSGELNFRSTTARYVRSRRRRRELLSEYDAFWSSWRQ